MTFWDGLIRIIITTAICFTISIALAKNTPPLTLKEAEHLGVSSHGLFAGTINQADTIKQEPEETKITFGIEKPPATNVTTYIQEPTNVYKVGVQQIFSENDSFNFQNQKNSTRHAAQRALQHEKNQKTLSDIRKNWLELYYWTQVIMLLQDKQANLQELLPSAGSFAPTLEAAIKNMKDQQQKAQQKTSILRNKLGHLIGSTNALRTLPEDLPTWPTPATIEKMRSHINRHPTLQADDARIAAIRAEISLGKSDQDSSVILGASYGVRQDDVIGGSTPHSDMISASISMKMGAPTEKGVDRTSRININRLEAAQAKQGSDYRSLTNELNWQYAAWQEKTAQLRDLAQQESAAEQNLDNINTAYQQAKANLTTLLDAYQYQLEVELATLRADVDVAQARATLLQFE